MKNVLLLLIIGLVAYGGYTMWNKHREATPLPQVADTKTEEVSPALKKEPTPVTAPEPPQVEPEKPKLKPDLPMPAAPSKRLAPDGVFYVVQAFSITTDAGVRGIRAGTPLRLIKDGGTTLRVSDGQQEFDARRESLTNDLDIAAQASGQQASQQAAIAEWQQKQQARAAANDQQKAMDVAASTATGQQVTESARAAAEQRTQRMADIRAQISSEEAAKRDFPRHLTHQRHLNDQNEKIRLLQLELGRLGVSGATLERK